MCCNCGLNLQRCFFSIYDATSAMLEVVAMGHWYKYSITVYCTFNWYDEPRPSQMVCPSVRMHTKREENSGPLWDFILLNRGKCNTEFFYVIRLSLWEWHFQLTDLFNYRKVVDKTFYMSNSTHSLWCHLPETNQSAHCNLSTFALIYAYIFDEK